MRLTNQRGAACVSVGGCLCRRHYCPALSGYRLLLHARARLLVEKLQEHKPSNGNFPLGRDVIDGTQRDYRGLAADIVVAWSLAEAIARVSPPCRN